MKKLILFIFTIFLVLTIGTKFLIIPKAQDSITDYFVQAGFKNITLKNAQINVNGITFEQATLDKDGFNIAQNIEANIDWFSSTIKSLNIDTLKISSVINSPKDILQYKYQLKDRKIKTLLESNLTIKDITWDVATPKTALRITGNFSTIKPDSTKKDTFNLNLSAKQHELSFNSAWTGHFNEDNELSLNGEYSEFNIHTDILKIKRGTGWIGYNAQKTALQFDAGSGNLLGMPLSNISLVMDQKDKDYPAILRAQASGIENTKLYGDFNFSQTPNAQMFDIYFETKNQNEFISHLTKLEILPQSLTASALPSHDIHLYLQYTPENRFADGPFPFTLKAQEQGTETAKGNFLIYPDKLDVRGSAQRQKAQNNTQDGAQDNIQDNSKNSAILFLKTLLLIESNNGNNDDDNSSSFRFEGNLKEIL